MLINYIQKVVKELGIKKDQKNQRPCNGTVKASARSKWVVKKLEKES